MHEYSIVQALLDRVAEATRAHAGGIVHRVEVRLGALSGVDPDLLAAAYEVAREGTPCAGAVLAIDRVPAQWECTRCGRSLVPGGPLQCAGCGAPARLASGDEIVLSRVEMEVP